MLEQNRSVTRANALSTICCVIFFIATLVIAFVTNSITLMLDSSAWGIAIFSGVMYDKVIKMIKRPSSAKYNYGYDKFGPFSVVAESIFLVSVCMYTLKVGIQNMAFPDPTEHRDLALMLSLITGIVSATLSIYLYYVSKKTRSHILKVNAIAWGYDSIFAFGILIGFLIEAYLEKIGKIDLSYYVDPIMGILLALALLPIPIKMILHYVGELLDENPGGEKEAFIRKKILKFKLKSKIHSIKTLRIRNAGEKFFIDVCFEAKTTEDIYAIYNSIGYLEKELKDQLQEVDLTVKFILLKT